MNSDEAERAGGAAWAVRELAVEKAREHVIKAARKWVQLSGSGQIKASIPVAQELANAVEVLEAELAAEKEEDNE